MSVETLLERIDQFVEELGANLNRARTEQDDPLMSPRFNAIRSIERFPICENSLSDVIANLLDPHGEHAQGFAFLNAFLKIIRAPENFISLKTTAVIREAVTTSILSCTRRMDILIHSDSGAVMIENKPFDFDQSEQMNDYCDHLENTYHGRYIAVYLSILGLDPDISSLTAVKLENLKESRRYVAITYAQEIREWLRECINVCQSERVKWFLRELDDFVAHNPRLGTGDSMTSEKSLIIEYSTKSIGKLEIALRIGECYERLQKGIINAFAKRVVDKVATAPAFHDWTLLCRDFSARNAGISISKPSWTGRCEVRLGVDGQNTFIGIFDHLPLNPKNRERLSFDLNQFRNGRKEKEWPWWQYLRSDFMNWSGCDFLLSLHREEKQPLDYVVGQLCSIASIAAPIIDEQILGLDIGA